MKPAASLDTFETALLAKLMKQMEDMDAKDIDGKPTWDAKSRVAFFEAATNYVIKRRDSLGAKPMGGKLGGD